MQLQAQPPVRCWCGRRCSYWATAGARARKDGGRRGQPRTQTKYRVPPERRRGARERERARSIRGQRAPATIGLSQ
eukprot:9820853-Alexandrium_andersonii.AAC.1